ncbi:MAG: hypothetical protein QW197_02490 [Candidatus Aenigmatarchaeota archaeon]
MAEKSLTDTSKLINLINDLNLYLKFIEQRVVKAELEIKSLRELLNNIDKKITKFQEEQSKELDELKNRLNTIELELDKIKAELKRKADLTDVKEIKELFDLFNPLKSVFVTKEEVKRIVEELININKERK